MVRKSFCAGLLCLAAAPAFAAPKDCSTAPIPATPVKGVVAGKPFTPNEVDLQITKNGMQINEAKFDRYTLRIETGGIFNALTVDALSRQGAKLEGHVFRLLPVSAIDSQPAAIEGTPEIQGWDLQLESANVDTSFTQDQASLRLEYGARRGDMIPGKIYFCSATTKTEIAGTFTAKIDQ